MLSHKNIVQVKDRGVFGGYPFIVMEYLAGGTLRDLIESRDRIPGSVIFSVAKQIADAIDFSHANGVIHRDVKSSNILFESAIDGRVVLIDFGIAKTFRDIRRDISHYGIIGSPAYIAPEIVEGKVITEASDIYGFGVVLFAMITKRVPFDDLNEAYAILIAKVSQDSIDIRKYRDIPMDLAVRINKTLTLRSTHVRINHMSEAHRAYGVA